MRKLPFILVFWAFCHVVMAQVPGYQGKVFHAGVGFSAFPGVFSIPADFIKSRPDYESSIALFGFHKKYEAYASYVFSRKSMLGLNAKTYNSVVILKDNAVEQNTVVGTDAQGNPLFAATLYTFTENLFFNVYQVGVSYTLFGSGYVAPLGKSITIEYGRIFYSNQTTTVSSFSDQFIDIPTLYKDFDVAVNENVGYISAGVNSSRVFFDRFIGSVGIDLTLVLGGERGLLNLAGEAPIYETVSDLSASLARKSIRKQNYASIKLGIGYLIF